VLGSLGGSEVGPADRHRGEWVDEASGIGGRWVA
jgi:hypothetical protein